MSEAEREVDDLRQRLNQGGRASVVPDDFLHATTFITDRAVGHGSEGVAAGFIIGAVTVGAITVASLLVAHGRRWL